jgi:hypothetical protein
MIPAKNLIGQSDWRRSPVTMKSHPHAALAPKPAKL